MSDPKKIGDAGKGVIDYIKKLAIKAGITKYGDCPQCKNGVVFGVRDDGKVRKMEYGIEVFENYGNGYVFSHHEMTGKSIDVCTNCRRDPRPKYVDKRQSSTMVKTRLFEEMDRGLKENGLLKKDKKDG